MRLTREKKQKGEVTRTRNGMEEEPVRAIFLLPHVNVGWAFHRYHRSASCTKIAEGLGDRKTTSKNVGEWQNENALFNTRDEYTMRSIGSAKRVGPNTHKTWISHRIVYVIHRSLLVTFLVQPLL